MRKLLIIATCVLLYSCKTGYIDKELKGNLFDKFDYELWNNHYEGFKKGTRNNNYIYKGIEFHPVLFPTDVYIYIYPQKKQFYTIYNEYYRGTFNLKQRGKIFGTGHDCCIEESIRTLKIGIWYQYDEQGKLIKETDEDKKFGKFGYNELLQFLDKEKQINLHKGVDRDSSGDVDFVINFLYSELSNKKLWTVSTKITSAHIVSSQDGEVRAYKQNTYHIDGNTGRVLKNFKIEKDYYKEIMN